MYIHHRIGRTSKIPFLAHDFLDNSRRVCKCAHASVSTPVSVFVSLKSKISFCLDSLNILRQLMLAYNRSIVFGVSTDGSRSRLLSFPESSSVAVSFFGHASRTSSLIPKLFDRSKRTGRELQSTFLSNCKFRSLETETKLKHVWLEQLRAVALFFFWAVDHSS